MAQPDGSIIVDAEIQTQKFEAGSKELQSAIKSLNSKVEQLGPTIKKAVSGNSGAFSTASAKMETLESKAAEYKQRLDELGRSKIPTDDYKWLANEVQKAEDELSRLADRQAKMEATGVSKSSQAWRSLQYDIGLAQQKVREYKAEMAQLESTGGAFKSGADTEQYAKLNADLQSATQKMAQMKAETERVNKSAKKASSSIGKMCKKGVINGFKKLGNVLKKLGKNMTSLFKSTQRANRGFSGGMATMLKYGLVMNVFYSAISAVSKALTEGIENLAQYSSGVNSSLSMLMSALTQLKNSIATAFAPILTAVAPMLTKLINLLSAAATKIGEFFSALTGQSTYVKATAVQQDYAASLEDTAGAASDAADAAKEAERQLAGFDDLNVLSDNSSDSSAGTGANKISPSDMFETQSVGSAVSDFVGQLKSAFSSGDFEEVGSLIADKLNGITDRVDDWINNTLRPKGTKWAGIIARVLNGLIGGYDFEKLGKTLADGVNAVFDILNTFLTTFDWQAFGTSVANGLNGIINGVDWALLAQTLGNYANSWIYSLYGAVTTFDWNGLGSALATAINNLFSTVDWEKLGQTVSNAVTGVLSFIFTAIRETDWKGIGKALADCLNGIDFYQIILDALNVITSLPQAVFELVSGVIAGINWGDLIEQIGTAIKDWFFNFDWAGLFSSFAELLGSVLKAVFDIERALDELVGNAVDSVAEYFRSKIEECGGNVVEGFFKGILDAIAGVGEWIYNNIFEPFMQGFMSAFGIHSPATSMIEMGGYLIQGLLNGITSAFGSITSFFGEALSGIKSSISDAWSNVQTSTSEAWESIKTSITSKMNSAKTSAGSAWNSIKSTVMSTGSSLKSSVSSTWSNMTSTMTSKLSTMKSSVSSTFGSIKNSAKTWGSDICSNLANGMRSAMSWVTSAATSVASGIKSILGFSEPEKGPLSDFHTYMPDMIELMVKGIKGNQSKAIGAVSDMASAISKEVQNGDYALGVMDAGLGAGLSSFGDKVADSFSGLMDKLQAIADRVTFKAPTVVTSGIIPYSTSAKADGNADVGSTIEAGNDELKRAFVQALADAASLIVSAIQNYSGTTVNIDKNSLTDAIIEEINRRTRATGQSPILS